MNTNYSQYNTEDFKDAIIKSSKYFPKQLEEIGLTYNNWLKLVKVILDNESSYNTGFKPSHEQYRALITLAKRTLVDACPGSGKTATLIFKIFSDSAIFKYNLDDQLALTYTNAAAEEMRDRYIKLCRRYRANPVANIATIHSYARSVETVLSSLDVLPPQGMEITYRVDSEDDIGEDLDFDDDEILGWSDEEDQFETKYISDRDFISQAIEVLELPYTYINNIMNIDGWISTIIEKDIKTQDEFEQIVEFSSLDGIYLDDLLSIHRLTKEYRLKYNVMNFSDMLVGLYERLSKTEKISDISNPSIRNLLTLKVIYVDEFQDISPLQFKIIQELLRLNPEARLFCVGDADQAIYSFRGAYTGFLVKFKDYFTENVNWREDLYGGAEKKSNHGLGTSKDLLWDIEYNKPGRDRYETSDKTKLVGAFINDYVKNNGNSEINEENSIYDEKNIDLDKEIPDKILLTEDDVDIMYFTLNRRCGKEIIDISNNLIEYNNMRYPKEMKPIQGKSGTVDINISVPDKNIRKIILDEILQLGIGSDVDYSKYAVIYREHRQGIDLTVDLLKNNIPINVKKEALPFEFKECKDILGIMSMIMTSKNQFLIEKYLYKVCASVNKNKAKFISTKIVETGKPFSNFLPNTKAAANDINKLRTCYRDLVGEDINRAISVICDSYVKHYLAFFSDNAYKVESIKYYLQGLNANNYMELLNMHEKIVKNAKAITNSPYGVTLTTMHSAKGLEFENVYIAPIGDFNMRKDNIIKKMESINKRYVKEYEEEERRLMYVSMTRAKKKLTIFLEDRDSLLCKNIINYVESENISQNK